MSKGAQSYRPPPYANATGRGGDQKSSTSNHRHPNVFCGLRAPQLVISTTSIGNHRKILFS